MNLLLRHSFSRQFIWVLVSVYSFNSSRFLVVSADNEPSLLLRHRHSATIRQNIYLGVYWVYYNADTDRLINEWTWVVQCRWDSEEAQKSTHAVEPARSLFAVAACRWSSWQPGVCQVKLPSACYRVRCCNLPDTHSRHSAEIRTVEKTTEQKCECCVGYLEFQFKKKRNEDLLCITYNIN